MCWFSRCVSRLGSEARCRKQDHGDDDLGANFEWVCCQPACQPAGLLLCCSVQAVPFSLCFVVVRLTLLSSSLAWGCSWCKNRLQCSSNFVVFLINMDVFGRGCHYFVGVWGWGHIYTQGMFCMPGPWLVCNITFTLARHAAGLSCALGPAQKLVQGRNNYHYVHDSEPWLVSLLSVLPWYVPKSASSFCSEAGMVRDKLDGWWNEAADKI